jgi:hypothetical protein
MTQKLSKKSGRTMLRVSNPIAQSTGKSGNLCKRRAFESPGSAIVSYKPDNQDGRVVNGLAFERGFFDAGSLESANKTVKMLHRKILKVLQRASDGDCKFARVMVMWNTATN